MKNLENLNERIDLAAAFSTDSQVHTIGNGAYWAVTLGPRSDVSVLSSYKNRSDKLPNTKRNLHTSASSLDGPPCGRPPDYSG